jgi:CheY-like chemotaxis protein
MIITDYSMPEMTGYELLKKVKGRKQTMLMRYIFQRKL